MEYSRVRTKKLKLKNGTRPKRSVAATEGEESRKRLAPSTTPGTTEEVEDVPIVTGSGRIVSSGSTVQGFETLFKDEIADGDELIVYHPGSLRDEYRIVVGILSQRALTVSEKFSTDFISTTLYKIKKDSVRLQKLADERQQQDADENPVASSSSGEKTDKVVTDFVSEELQRKLKESQKYQNVTYREKTGMWGYKTVTKRIRVKDDEEGVSEKHLDIRSRKMGRDKFCW
eukprot:Lankesteria_metandrocarpae@DN5181_c1_g1_i1.p1